MNNKLNCEFYIKSFKIHQAVIKVNCKFLNVLSNVYYMIIFMKVHDDIHESL